jgi:hypothetical protein
MPGAKSGLTVRKVRKRPNRAGFALYTDLNNQISHLGYEPKSPAQKRIM